MNYSDLENPYDFANPVTDKKLFAGREEELEDIKYYLRQGIKSRNPINLSLIGDRAAGKTSLLNMIEQQAEELNFLTVRIDLDEGDGQGQLSFFYKIFDSLLNAAVIKGLFGGEDGAVFDEYLNQTSAYSVSKDSSFRPFLFPVQYAKSMEAGRYNAVISESNFKRDLDKIREEFKGSIILLFDECNVLSTQRILLEKLRNIFMNKSNYMLVFTGTKEFFPVIDDIFSPIIRQFKKINVNEYDRLKETQACVDNPLHSIGIDPFDIFDFRTYIELHGISEGKPYEIQLVCHNMFKKIQEGSVETMTLSHEVLEDVRIELETSQNFDARPKLKIINTIDNKELDKLNILCKSLGKTGAHEIVNIEYLVNGKERYSTEELNLALNSFTENGILNIDETGSLNFFGDDFDKIYVKYFALERGISFEFNYLPVHHNIFELIRLKLDIDNVFQCSTAHNKRMHINSLNYFIGETDGEEVDLQSILRVYSSLFESNNSTLNHVELEFKINKIDTSIHFFTSELADVEKVKELYTDLNKRISEITTINEIIAININTIAIPSADALIQKILDLEQDKITKSIIKYHEEDYPDMHVRGEKEMAFTHASAIFKLDLRTSNPRAHLDSYNVQNLGYMMMVNNKAIEAGECFDALPKSMEPFHHALAEYNKGMVKLMSGDKVEYKTLMSNAISFAKEHDPTNGISCLCLYVAILEENASEPSFIEKNEDLDLILTAQEAIKLFD